MLCDMARTPSNEIARNAQLTRKCERLGMPLSIETLARGKEVQNPADPQWIKRHTWIATELGANVIKTAMPAASRACAKR
jgi:2-amino-4,5-dihydroxy-6-oxo-7-(phosphonooxy)heptanoate synthase